MIPSRIRSQASWIIIFKLNPIDFKSIYEDSILLDKKRWNELLFAVFGTNSIGELRGNSMTRKIEKSYDYLQIWVEDDAFFKN